MRLLLVEDDVMVGEAVRKGLKLDGFTVDWVRDGIQAETALADHAYDLLLLDLGLPRRDGLALLESLRRGGNDIPTLIITARDAVADRVRGLDAGADDYVVKPFDLDELTARVRALARRRGGRGQPQLSVGALTLDPARREVSLHGENVAVSPREFALLAALMENPGAVLSKETLEQRLYGWGEEVESNAVEVHVHNLRRKLGAQLIRTVRGMGYRIGDGA
ncbi:MAG TPA: response regulator [Pelomicrobium sp.]|nr:response regulator [Pelomicrobium sp.]